MYSLSATELTVSRKSFMKVTFLMPGCSPQPSGGYRVVYEYANQLVARGHQISVVHPRRLRYAPVQPRSVIGWAKQTTREFLNRSRRETVDWQFIDERVRMVFAPDCRRECIPDGDAIFATGWPTVKSVQTYPAEKGKKFYLIQGYESYHADKNLVDETWRSNLNKVVIARWLIDLGSELGCENISYIPNAINHEQYRLTRPITPRDKRVAMLLSTTPIKGARDGVSALSMVRERYGDVSVVFFGVCRRPGWLPRWVEYHRNPDQKFLVEEIYNRSSIFLAPSWTEGSPLPPAEALACGCAVVATDIGGFREYITDEETGLLAPVKTPAALADNICRLIADENLRVRLATAGNEQIGRLRWSRSAALMESNILKVLAREQ